MCSRTGVATFTQQEQCESSRRAPWPEDNIYSLAIGGSLVRSHRWSCSPQRMSPDADLGPLKPPAQPVADAVQRRLLELGTASEGRGKP